MSADQTATLADLQAYGAEPLAAPDDLLRLARRAAGSTAAPRAIETVSFETTTTYGFLGRKSRTSLHTREDAQDYWVLLEKESLSQEDSSNEGWTQRHETARQYRYCLDADGSLALRQRERVSTTNNGIKDDGQWSNWTATQVRDLDSYLIEFDFTGSFARQSPGWVDDNGWRETSETLANLTSTYTEGMFEGRNYYTIRRLHPKGAGLREALNSLLP